MNRITLKGRSGADAELRHTPNGYPVLNFSIAVNEKKNEEVQTQCHKIICYGKTAELNKERIKRGSEVWLEGKLQVREWMDKNNNKRTSVEVIANWLMVGADFRGQGSQDEGTSPSPSEPQVNVEDIPF